MLLRRQARRKSGKRLTAAVYARFSHEGSNSIEDQVRKCREFAEANDMDVPDDLVFEDRAVRGRRRRREGFDRLQAALGRNEFDVLLVFKTSRLFRKAYRALMFVQEEIVEQGKRCVFICSGIDTADEARWETLLHVNAMIDELGSRMGSDHIVAALESRFDAELVSGCLTYGYTGEPIEGQLTRSGKPCRRVVIDEEQAAWVKRVFGWFVEVGLSMRACARKLNELQAPLPPRCATGRWTKTAVRILLSNARYTGHWELGRYETKYLHKKDYVLHVRREKPRRSKQIERLRIIDDATWCRAQQLLATRQRPGGRRPKKTDWVRRPQLLNGLLICAVHECALNVGGSGAESYYCRTCSELPAPPLVSYVSRQRATEMICETIAQLVRRDADLVEQVVRYCREAAEAALRPDPKHLAALKNQVAKLSTQINFILRNPGHGPNDQAENAQALAEARRERDAKRAESAAIEAAAERAINVPDREKVRQMLEDLASVLDRAPTGADSEEAAVARRVIATITGGGILMTQAGDPTPKRGWLRGRFKMHVIQCTANMLKYPTNAPEELREVTIEFRRFAKSRAIAQTVKELWNTGFEFKEIACQVGVSVTTVVRAFRAWHDERGLEVPKSNNKAAYARRRARRSHGEFPPEIFDDMLR